VDSYWGPATKVMADTNFLNNLMDYDKDHIPEVRYIRLDRRLD
jgi:hypothetical protein